MNNLKQYLQDNFIKFKEVSEQILEIDNKTYELVFPIDGKLFDSCFEMTCDDTEEDNYIFNFGGKYYWTPKGSETNPQLNLLKYIGEANIQAPYIPWLGIHGKYEILNGSRDYKDWCKKAKFLKTKTLGICELNTLAGTLQFQEECKNNNIKPILGATYTILDKELDKRSRVKVFVKNEQGWKSILKLNKYVLVDNNKFIYKDEFFRC